MGATAYQQIKVKMGVKRGRKPLAPEERTRREALRKIINRRKMEARRRANYVLEVRYKEEFDRLYKEEYEALTKEHEALGGDEKAIDRAKAKKKK